MKKILGVVHTASGSHEIVRLKDFINLIPIKNTQCTEDGFSIITNHFVPFFIDVGLDLHKDFPYEQKTHSGTEFKEFQDFAKESFLKLLTNTTLMLCDKFSISALKEAGKQRDDNLGGDASIVQIDSYTLALASPEDFTFYIGESNSKRFGCLVCFNENSVILLKSSIKQNQILQDIQE